MITTNKINNNNKPIIYAGTTNLLKTMQIKALFNFLNLNEQFELEFPMQEILDCEEVGLSLIENAIIKARNIYTQVTKKCFIIGDDTGLMVESLNNEPHIYTKRYSSMNHYDGTSPQLVLEKLKGIKNRKAVFTTCIVLLNPEQTFTPYVFQSNMLGTIIDKEYNESIGSKFDAIFQPTCMNNNKVLCDYTEEEKVQLFLNGSMKEHHRLQAILQCFNFLKHNYLSIIKDPINIFNIESTSYKNI